MTDTTTLLHDLTDRHEITDLVSRLGLWLDEGRFDEAPSILIDDVTVDTPGGHAEGIEHVIAQARRNHQHDHLQHVITNVLIDLDGDRATVRANLVVTFADDAVTSQQGERYRFEAVRTPDGWRLSRIEVVQVWKVEP
jgi:3-phenylpropionate/cinnamic acid dioxygenase small subunit